MEILRRFLIWVLWKVVIAAGLVLLGVTAVGGGLFLWEKKALEFENQAAARQLRAEGEQLINALANADAQMAELRTGIPVQLNRAEQAGKVVASLEELSSGFNRLTTSSEQLLENDNRLNRMKQMELEARHQAGDLQQNLARTQWEKEGIEIALQRNQQQLAAADSNDVRWLQYGSRAWNAGWRFILLGVAIIMLIPLLRRWGGSRRAQLQGG